jgi:succinylarginine dihydrolase
MPDESRFAVHAAILPQEMLSDEGAANHMRMAPSAGAQGVEIFVYGRKAGEARTGFPARQTLEASQAVARRHKLDIGGTVFTGQALQAIDAGAFHNDVVAVAHEHVLFHHEDAFADKAALYDAIRKKARGFTPLFLEVPRTRVGLDDAVSSYLFNSQLVRLPGAPSLTLIAPTEVRENNRTAAYAADLVGQSDGAIGQVDYVEVRESMRNGGGPACLRLRIAMTLQERAWAAQGFFLDDALAAKLGAWIKRHYREELAPEDLGDPSLVGETQRALDDLTRILPLGGDFYPFQRAGA